LVMAHDKQKWHAKAKCMRDTSTIEILPTNFWS
jgi:hypothetical protein